MVYTFVNKLHQNLDNVDENGATHMRYWNGDQEAYED